MSPEQYKLLLELTELFENGHAKKCHLVQLKELLSMVNKRDSLSNQEGIPTNLSSLR